MPVGKRIEPVFSPSPFPPFLGKRVEAQKGKKGSHNAHMPASSSSFSSSSSSSCGEEKEEEGPLEGKTGSYRFILGEKAARGFPPKI